MRSRNKRPRSDNYTVHRRQEPGASTNPKVRDMDKKSFEVKSVDEGTIAYKGKDKKGQAYELDLPLREDIIKKSLHSEILPRPDKWGDSVLITVDKQTKHAWDALTTNTPKFKKMMDKDWTREDQSLEPDEELPYFEDNSAVLKEVSRIGRCARWAPPVPSPTAFRFHPEARN